MIKKGHKIDMTLSIIIFVVVICVLVFITANREDKVQTYSYADQFDNTGKREGVKVTVLREGQGDVSKVGDTIAVNYVGSFESGEIFESNIGEGPYEVVLGTTPVIKGWAMGVIGMKAGERRNIEINPEYAYGEKGVPGVVPPYAKLVYDIEIVAIKN